MLIKSIIVNTFSKSENVFPFRKIVFPFLRSRHQTLNDDLLDADFSFLDDCRKIHLVREESKTKRKS